MSRWLIGGVAVMLTALAVALVRPTEPVSAAPPEEREFGKGVALRVTRKQAGEPFYLSSPRAVRVGERSFLYGWRVDADAAVYIPISEIELIEEFGSVDVMKKRYRVGPADAKTAGDKK